MDENFHGNMAMLTANSATVHAAEWVLWISAIHEIPGQPRCRRRTVTQLPNDLVSGNKYFADSNRIKTFREVVWKRFFLDLVALREQFTANA